jgi:hypothetical protein
MATFPSKANYVTGEVLTATNMNDIGEAINLLDGAQFAAGVNKIINGDFAINQRAFTSTTTTGTYGFDRFTLITAGDGSTTYSAQTFTPGAAPVAGYEAANYARLVTTGQTSATVRSSINQFIEDVRTCAGQTVTISFWAKAASGTPKVAVEMRQDFGSGGSTAVNTYAGQVTLSTSWTRYSVTVAVPSISGKTIGTSSTLVLLLYVSAGTDFNSRTGTLGIQTGTFDFWGVQVEAAQTASNFQTATGTKQGELAACQRYYIRWNGSEGANSIIGTGLPSSAGAGRIVIPLPVTMRTTPATLDYSTLAINYVNAQVAITTATISGSGLANPRTAGIEFSGASGLTAYWSVTLVINNSASGYLGLGAEL